MKKSKTSRRKNLETLDLSKLTPIERKRVERAINRRDHTLSLKFRKRDVDVWSAVASKRDESLTDWVERNLNIAAETNS